MSDVGRPSQLNDEQFLLKIRNLVIDGKTENQIQEMLEIPKGTWDYWKWKNYESFQDKLMLYRHERKLILADMVSDDVLLMDVYNDGKIDTGILTNKVKESQFIRETLGKKNYSKRSELTGEDGKDLSINLVSYKD